MSWANLDDRLHAHPKVQELRTIPIEGMMAFGLWTWALSWCRAYSPSDGVVSVKAAALSWNADPEMIRQLVDVLVQVGLAERDDRDGPAWSIHDWDDWQIGASDEWHKAGGRARAATARRVGGRFAPADQQAGSAGTSMATPLHATPLRTSPRLDHGFEAVRETVTALALPRPAPKPVRAKP
jgi:hypothetical protein